MWTLGLQIRRCEMSTFEKILVASMLIVGLFLIWETRDADFPPERPKSWSQYIAEK